MPIFKIAFLIILLQLLHRTNKPILCAGIYSGLAFVTALMFGSPFLPVLLFSAFGFLLAWLYFWLLDRLEGSFFWWIVMFGGLAIGLV